MNNIPFADYKKINTYNHMLDPSQMHSQNTGLAHYFQKYLIQKIFSIFEFKNIPEHWSKEYFLYTLMLMGHIAVIETDKFGVIPQQCSLYGYNVFYQPNKLVINNPLINKSIDLTINENCTLIKMQPDYMGCWDIVSYYADLYALASESIAVNLVNSKLAYIFCAENKTVAESFKKMYDEIASGKPAVFADKSLFDENGNAMFQMNFNNIKNEYIASEILNDFAQIESRFNSEIGIPNNNIVKESGVSESEIKANNDSTFSKSIIWLETIKDGIIRTNEMFNLDIDVSLRYMTDENGGDFNG